MQSLREIDAHFVLSRVPRDVRALAKAESLFIAGGFIRSTIAGEKPSDVDLFGPSREALELHALKFAQTRECRYHATENAFTVLSGSRLPVQFIHRWLYPAGEEGALKLLAEFDFTVAQAALWYEAKGTSEGRWRSLVSDDFYADLAARRLVYTHPNRPEDAGGSILRVRKFLARGYNIQPLSFAGVISRLALSVRWDEVTTEAQATKVIAGLLREVDPLMVVDGVLVDEHERDE
ncbi:MAG: hypothetical protein JWM53_5862 [bacterium]|nr:hypothetical protein [bacterium]